jgi:hypothetical protein
VCPASCVLCPASCQSVVNVPLVESSPLVASHARPRLGKAIGEMARFCQRPARGRFNRCFGAFAKQFACQTNRPRAGLGCSRHGAGIQLAASRIRKRLCFSESPLNPPGQASARAIWAASRYPSGRTAHLVPASCPVAPTRPHAHTPTRPSQHSSGHSTWPDGRRWGRGALDNGGAEAISMLRAAHRAPPPPSSKDLACHLRESEVRDES